MTQCAMGFREMRVGKPNGGLAERLRLTSFPVQHRKPKRNCGVRGQHTRKCGVLREPQRSPIVVSQKVSDSGSAYKEVQVQHIRKGATPVANG
eukprot:1933910-Rhodomonas_salina.1